jgi:plasmid maintenance system antidote protein VapI
MRTDAWPLASWHPSILGKRAISADTALRLARYFGTSERFWLNLQSRFDLEVERDRRGNRLRNEVTVLRAAS